MRPRPIEFDDGFRIVWPSQPAIGPDGRRVAFVTTRLDEGSDSIVSQVLCVETTAGPEPTAEPRVVAEGWVPLYTAGKPTMWYYSRGC